MATLTVQSASEAGTAITWASATAAGDVVPNDGKTVILVTNGSGAPITVTVAVNSITFDHDRFGTLTKDAGGGSVAAGATKAFGPFPPQAYNNASGQVALTYSSDTTVTTACVSV